MIKTYRKRPVTIEAVEWTGDNIKEVLKLGDVIFEPLTKTIVVQTLEGSMLANVGDYIIKGIKNELYPCKPDIFKVTYEVI